MTSDATKKADEAEEKESFQAPAWACMAIFIVMCAAVLHRNNFEVSNAAAWCNQLFEPHVVPGPPAAKTEVAVQFCKA